MREKREQTTVTINLETSAKLDRLARASGVSKKDFISLSLDYFLKNGIDPTTAGTPIAEIEKITKRFNQFFAFFKKQEQEILRPMYEQILESEKNIKENLINVNNNVVKSHNLNVKMYDKQLDELKTIIQNNNENRKFSNSEFIQVKKGLENLLKLVDEKNKSGLMGKLFG